MKTAWIAAICVACSTAAEGQTRWITVRGFADAGSTTFMAGRSFTAVLGQDSGAVYGGGGEAIWRRRAFVNLRASRFRRTGERVLLHGRERFGLGIPTTVTITPLELTGGYRHDDGSRVVPYGGGGLGLHRYGETSQFAGRGEDVHESFRGYHLMGGTELRIGRWIASAVELQWATVPHALGADANGVSHEFRESNLGGTTMRVKIVVGR